MLFFQDDKDKLKLELDTINRKLDELKGMQEYQQTLIDHCAQGISMVMDKYPHGAKKDGTPRAKPGRKPRELTALEELRNLSAELASDPNKRADFLRMTKKLKPEMPAGFEELK